jgi:uncharacterized membrane protein
MTSRRYDGAALERALVLAARLQQEHQQTVSADEIEQLGAEIGIAPEFVRSALAVIDEETVSPRKASPIMLPPARRRFRLRNLLTITAALLVADLMLAVALQQPAANRDVATYRASTLVMVLVYVVPPLITCVMGWQARQVRNGGIVGALGGLALVLAHLAIFRTGIEFWAIAVTAALPVLGAGVAAFRIASDPTPEEEYFRRKTR